MVESLWSNSEAAEFIARYDGDEQLALRVYTSRLIGRDDDLVLHGGGNTSVKTTTRDLLGRELDVLAVKGSGWDLVSIEPQGLPFVQLEPLRQLLTLSSLSDEQMVNEVRRQLLDASAPNPSVETLLHAALPHRFVDHTHADAILILGNQPDGEARIREALGEDVGILPWIMPGFPLAKAVAQLHAENPELSAIVLLQHGIFTFADDARESYERMIEMVQRAEGAIASVPPHAKSSIDSHDLACMAQSLRGAMSIAKDDGSHRRFLCDFRASDDLRGISDSFGALAASGPLTPDHVIRTKGPYLYLDREQAKDGEAVRDAVTEYETRYRAYFADNAPRMPSTVTMLDPRPRVAVVAGIGIFAFGDQPKAARIAADIAEHTLVGKWKADQLGSYTPLPPDELFAMEYWSLEQAKLGKKQPPLLGGQVALITGGAGAIGIGIADRLAQAGAAVVIADLTLERANQAVETLGGGEALFAVEMDVTDADSVERAFDAATLRFGGVDIVVPNAGVAAVASLEEMDPTEFRRVIDVNLTGTMTTLREASRVFRRQQSGGSVIVQASKNVFAPGASFGAYSAGKAGQHQLGKIAAQELAPLGVRVNMINADAVFGDSTPSGLWETVGEERMKSRGMKAEELREHYRQRSLLQREITPRHVGDAVVFLASELAARTTGVTLTVDGGIPQAFPR